MEYPTLIYCDNQLVVMNASLQINSIAYHFVYEGSEKDEWRCGRLGTDYNPSDLMTKFSITGDNVIRKVRT